MSGIGSIGTLIGRALKLRYLVFTGAVGGGISMHQVSWFRNIHDSCFYKFFKKYLCCF